MYKIVSESREWSCSDWKAHFIRPLKTKWDEIHDKTDAFSYKIGPLKEKTTESNFLLQLNPNIFLKCRPPEYIEQVRQHFSKNSFNFTKAAKEEIILHMVNADLDTHDEYNRHTLLVSVSPIIKYHTLLCPLLKQCRPQVATEDSINLILNIMKLAKDRDLRIGFNSLCALAAVNHLHYHLFWLPNELPVESAQCTQVKGELYRFENYRAPAFCFQVDDKSDNIHKDIYKLIRYFLEKSIAHNMVVTRGREIKDEESRKEVIRVVIWPRKSCGGVKQLTTFSVAVCELSGWFPISDVSSFNTLTENDIIFELDKWKMDNFDSLCAQVETFF